MKRRILAKRLSTVTLVLGLVLSVPAWSEEGIPEEDLALARQLDAEARALIVEGDFATALKKLEAAEVMAPDPVRAKRIERVRAFVQVREEKRDAFSAAPAGPAETQATALRTSPPQPKEERNTATAPAPTAPSGAPTAGVPLPPPLPQSAGPAAGAAVPSPAEGRAPAMQPPPLPSAATVQSALTPEQQRVRAMVDGFLASLERELEGGVGLVYDRNYAVESDGDAYRVTLDSLRLMDGDRAIVDLGPVVIEATLPNDSQVGFHVQVPDRFDLYDGDQPVMRITLGGHRIQGVWNDRLQVLDELNLGATGLRLEDPEGAMGHIGLDDLRLDTRVATGGNGGWSQVVTLALKGFEVHLLDGSGGVDTDIRIAALRLEAAAEGRDRERMVALAHALEDLERRMEAAQDPQARQALEGQVGRTVGDLIALLDGYRVNLALDDNSFLVEGEQFRFGALALAFGLGKSGDGHAEMTALWKLKEAHLPPSAEIPEQFQPVSFALDLKLAGLPEMLFELVRQALAQEEPDPELLGQMQQALLAGKPHAEVRELALRLAGYGAHMAGTVRLDPQSPWMTTGDLQLEVFDLPGLMKTLGSQPQDEELKQILAKLALVSVRKEEGGKTVDHYHLQWGRDGRILLNGKDATVLFAEPQGGGGKQGG